MWQPSRWHCAREHLTAPQRSPWPAGYYEDWVIDEQNRLALRFEQVRGHREPLPQKRVQPEPGQSEVERVGTSLPLQITRWVQDINVVR